MKLRAIILAAFAIVVVGLGAGAYILVFWPASRFVPARIVSIYRGENLSSAAVRLRRAGVIRSSAAFIVYAELTAQANLLKPGDYAFKGAEAVPAVLRHLVNGDFMVVSVTIPEGLTVHQIAQRLAAAGLVCDSVFDRAARDGPIPRALGMGLLGTEGFLFPATYRFSPLASPEQILMTMLERFYANLTPAVEQRMFSLGLSLRQLVTLASMVEKEAKLSGERPLIASVFYNRLARGMPLQSDPTAQYNYAGESRRAAVAVHSISPFNTYDIRGLPPGPIANPGLDSIRAVLYPAHTDYLYFVARRNGSHIFSRSFQEHRRAIEQVKRTSEADGPRG